MSPDNQRRLLAHATLLTDNRRKSLSTITEELEINVLECTLRRFFDSHGYHRCIARTKPFLTAKQKVERQLLADTFGDWGVEDWNKVIWTDECAFNVGGFAGNTWVTRTAQEEYQEDCIVPKFYKLKTIMVWGSICGNIKGPIVIWNNEEWGKSVNGISYCDHIITPHLYPFWYQLSSERLDYVYLQQDGAPAHHTKVVIRHLLPWPYWQADFNMIG